MAMNFYSNWKTPNQLMKLSQKIREIVIEGQLMFSSACLLCPHAMEHTWSELYIQFHTYTQTHTHTQ